MFLNVAAYKFVDLDDLPGRRERLRSVGARLGVRGTVLLAPEGVNLFLSAREDALRSFMAQLRADPALAGLRAHESWSDEVAFARFLVRLKREVITYHRPGIRPADRRAPAVAPQALARWLDAGHDDAGRPLALLDTRNAFEVAVGSFDGAIDPGLRSFTDLPAALDTHRPQLRGKRVVTFCTGGIRCEKAALAMAADGFEHVVQLDGGVLGWFDRMAGRHWRGELFVFDRRVSVTPELRRGSWRQDFPGRGISRRPDSHATAAPPR